MIESINAIKLSESCSVVSRIVLKRGSVMRDLEVYGVDVVVPDEANHPSTSIEGCSFHYCEKK